MEKASFTKYKNSISNLCKYLKKHFNKKVIVLVDEYDAPIIKAFQNSKYANDKTYYKNVINFMQTFLGSVFKGNENNLQKGLLTGVMRVGKESIFSKWNNLSIFGITSNYFAEYFGFTKKETDKMLKYFNLKNDIDKIKEWYDGYKFGDIDNIYNPWSIANYIAYEKDGFKAYWVNTGNSDLIKEKIKEPNIKSKFKELIEGKTIIKVIKENFVFPEFEYKTELLWTLLFYSGFLTKKKQISLNLYV